MSFENITRQELYDAIERQSAYLEQIVTNGFSAVNKRLDVANGRTSKLEDRLVEAEKVIAVLKDRAFSAEDKATRAQISATTSKWISAFVAATSVGVIEAIKGYFN